MRMKSDAVGGSEKLSEGFTSFIIPVCLWILPLHQLSLCDGTQNFMKALNN